MSLLCRVFASCLSGDRVGFTLIELLVVIAIIGILAVAAVPQVFDMICESRVTARKSDISTVRTAIQQCEMADSLPAGGDGDCWTLDEDYSDFLPDRIWNSDDWGLNDPDSDESVEEIEVTNVGCSWDDSHGNSGDSIRYEVETGNFIAFSSGGSST